MRSGSCVRIDADVVAVQGVAGAAGLFEPGEPWRRCSEPPPFQPPDPILIELPPPPPGTYYWRLRVKDTTQPTFEYNPWSEPRSFTVDPTGPDLPLLDWFQTTDYQFLKDELSNAMTNGDGVIIMNEAEPATLTTPVITLADLTLYSGSEFTQWDQVVVNVSHPDPFTSIQIDVLDDFDLPLLPPTFDRGTGGPRDVPVDVPLMNPKVKVRVVLNPGSTPTVNSVRVSGDAASAVGVSETETPAPARLRLLPASPNPFRSATVIAFTVPEGSETVSLRVFDLQGGVVRTLIDGGTVSGAQSVSWDGRDDGGAPLPAGIYLYRLSGDGYQASGKVIRVGR